MKQSLAYLDRIHLSIELNLITLHNLLNTLTDITQSNINPSSLDPRLGPLLHSLQERIKLGIKTNRPGTVNNPPVNLRPEVDLHNIIVLQHGVISTIGCIVRRDVIDTASSGEADAPVQPVLLHERSIAFLEPLAHVDQLDAGPDEGLGVVAHLSMDLGGVAELGVEVSLEALGGAQLLGGEAVGVGFEGVGLDLSGGEVVGGEEVDDGDGGRLGLAVGDVVVGEGAFVEHAALGFGGWRALGQGRGAACLFLLFLDR